jgi:hypothetical protein
MGRTIAASETTSTQGLTILEMLIWTSLGLGMFVGMAWFLKNDWAKKQGELLVFNISDKIKTQTKLRGRLPVLKGNQFGQLEKGCSGNSDSRPDSFSQSGQPFSNQALKENMNPLSATSCWVEQDASVDGLPTSGPTSAPGKPPNSSLD